MLSTPSAVSPSSLPWYTTPSLQQTSNTQVRQSYYSVSTRLMKEEDEKDIYNDTGWTFTYRADRL